MVCVLNILRFEAEIVIKSVIEMWKREAGVRLHVEKLVTIFKMNEMDVTDSQKQNVTNSYYHFPNC